MTALRDWLTGFSKRKKAKVDERRAKAKARDHQEHLEERRKVSARLIEAEFLLAESAVVDRHALASSTRLVKNFGNVLWTMSKLFERPWA